jgi:tRNA(adenine34) deaminase
MEQAINIAKQVREDIPVGAIIVKNGEIISSAFNTKEKDNDITSHAEIIAIRKAEKIINNWRLEDCNMYVTLEPCPMCGWAIIQSRIKNLYFGSYDSVYGAFSSKIDLRQLTNSKLKVYGGIMENECDKILADYFQSIRK